MEHADIRLGHFVSARCADEQATGHIESGHAGEWMIRTREGELTGPWSNEDVTLAHADYPHEPGRLYDCAACEARCHCKPGETLCIFCGTLPPGKVDIRRFE